MSVSEFNLERDNLFVLKELFLRRYDKTKIYTEEELEEIFEDLRRYKDGFNISDASWQRIVSSIKSLVSVQVTLGESITDGKGVPWVRDYWEESDRYYWNRFANLRDQTCPWQLLTILMQ